MPAVVPTKSRLPGAYVCPTIWRVARSKTHLAPARFGTTERLLQGFPKNRPSIDITTGVHSRRLAGCPAPRLRQVVASDPHVPPSWSLTTSTVCSTDGSWACCIPLPILGFIGFRPHAAPSLWCAPRGVPADAIPFRAFPTRKAAPSLLTAVALLPFRAASWVTRARSTSRPCSVRASVVANSRCRSSAPVALLGFPVSGASQPSSRVADRRPKPSTARPGHPLGGVLGVHLPRSPTCGAARRPHHARSMSASMKGGLPAGRDRRPVGRHRSGWQAHGASASPRPIAGGWRAALRDGVCMPVRETKTTR